MNHPILVTGATGTIGSYLIDELLQRKTKVRALVRNPSDRVALVERGLEVSVGDLSKPDSLRAALTGVSRAFLLTPGAPYHPDGVRFAQNFISAVKVAGVDYIVRQSIWGASAEATKPQVMKDHAQIEADLAESGLDYTVLHTNYGMQSLQAQGIIGGAQAEGKFYLGQGEVGVAYVDLRDVATVAAICLTEDGHAGQRYKVSGPEVLTANDLANTL